MQKKLALTVILPVHNEASRLPECVKSVVKACEKITRSFEIVITEDGSRDNTFQVAKKLAAKDPRIKVSHSEKRLGRGKALAKALRNANGKISVYMDADLSSNLKHLKDLVSHVEDGAVIATGSRLMEDSSTKRSAKRDIASRGFNTLVRLILGSKLRDHQCGFKAFDTKKIQPLLNETEDEHWFWDTEILVRAQRKGLRVDEIPIEWAEKGKATTVNLRRDVAYMASKILYLKGKIG
ncbi:Glycosyltransferase AglD [uncultured archaeon]|nr:Glycosyltransferase AglD [uncultured archaeon]